MYSPQKLHPLSYLTGLIKTIKQNIIVIILFFINIKDFNFANVREYIWPAMMIGIFLISFIINALAVYSTRYWIEGHHFVVIEGVFNKKRKELDIQRIQTFDSSQDIISRIFGGMIMEIKTPSDSIQLEIVSKKQFEDIEQNIKAVQYANDQPAEQNETVEGAKDESKSQQLLFKLSLKELILMALSSGSIGIALVTLTPILGTFQEIIPWESLFDRFEWIAHAAYVAVAGLIITALLAAYIIGVIIEFVRSYGYTLTEENEQLHIKHGLLSVKTVNVPIRRIQAVVEKQSFIRRFIGYTSISFIITSDGHSSEESESASGDVVILPFIKRQKAYEMVQQLVPSMAFQDVPTGLPKGGIRRHAQIGVALLLIAGGICTYFWSVWYLVLAAFISVLFIVNSIMTVLYSGYMTDASLLTVKKTQLLRTRYFYVKKDKIIGFEKAQNLFMQHAELADFNFKAARGLSSIDIGLRFIPDRETERLKQWYIKEGYDETKSNGTRG